MPRLVVLDAVGGPGFVDALRRAWEGGDAVLPLDPRLPPPARRELLATMRVEEPVDDGDALVVATSGTTGAPRGAVLTLDAVLASAAATSLRLGVDPATDRWLACLPLSHVGGLSVVTRALLTTTGLTFDADDPATLVSLVPTQLKRLDTSRFRLVVLGGSHPPEVLPPNAVATYGMTETGSGVVYDGVPLAGVELRLGPGGQISVRGPMLMRCYRDGHDPKDAQGWLATGDLGAMVHGRLRVHGRAAEMIVTGGEKVWPRAVERRLRAHPLVADVAVTGTPDEEWGQRVVAVIVPVRASSPPSLDDLRGWVREELPSWCAPKELVVRRSLPRTALGKLRRAGLEQR